MTGIYSTPFWLESAYAAGSLVITTGLIWTLALLNKINKTKIIVLLSFAVFFFIASYWSGFIAKNYNEIYLGGFTGQPALGLYIYTIFFILIALLILYEIFSAQKKEVNEAKKNQLLYVFYGALITLIISTLTSFVLPSLSVFRFGGLDSVSFLIFLSFIAYAITKHHLFNIKTIATELLTFAIWIAVLFDLLTQETWRGRFIEGGLFVFVVVFGIFLIRSVIKEVRQREEMERLAKELEKLNSQLSVRTKQLTSLKDFTTSLIKTLDFKEIIQIIVNGIVERFGYAGVFLTGVSEDGKYLYPLAISKNKPVELALKLLPKKLEEYKEEIENNQSLSAQAIQTNSIQISEDFGKFFSVVPSVMLSGMQSLIGFKTALARMLKIDIDFFVI
ncbi:MAG: hypothetical protein AAB405_02435 [Patescibacteria group bacterium]